MLWDIPDHLISRATSGSRKSLDQIEGDGINYERTPIDVIVQSEGKPMMKSAWTYFAKVPKDGLETSLEYVTEIIQGLKENRIPQTCRISQTYIDKVKRAAKRSNPALELEIDQL